MSGDLHEIYELGFSGFLLRPHLKNVFPNWPTCLIVMESRVQKQLKIKGDIEKNLHVINHNKPLGKIKMEQQRETFSRKFSKHYP